MSETPATLRWTVAWPDWYGIPGNVEVVPASDFDAARAEIAVKDANIEGLVNGQQVQVAVVSKLRKEIALLQAELAGSKRAIELLEEHQAEEIAGLRERVIEECAKVAADKLKGEPYLRVKVPAAIRALSKG